MAEGTEPQPLGARNITVESISSKANITDQKVYQYGKLVTVSVRFQITETLGNTESILSGFPIPLGGDMVVNGFKNLGGGNYNMVLSNIGQIRNNWDGINSAYYIISFTYIAA